MGNGIRRKGPEVSVDVASLARSIPRSICHVGTDRACRTNLDAVAKAPLAGVAAGSPLTRTAVGVNVEFMWPR
eukprot:161876-Chlamydomonas_euryale.AAC.1